MHQSYCFSLKQNWEWPIYKIYFGITESDTHKKQFWIEMSYVNEK